MKVTVRVFSISDKPAQFSSVKHSFNPANSQITDAIKPTTTTTTTKHKAQSTKHKAQNNININTIKSRCYSCQLDCSKDTHTTRIDKIAPDHVPVSLF